MIDKYFLAHTGNAPKRKIRGKRRYFKKVQIKAEKFSLPLTNEDWYDDWHYHADWEGVGNLGWNHRKQHILSLCHVYKNIAENLKSYPNRHQLWFYLNQGDAGQDAVFIHTPNPNGENFPKKMNNTTWGEPIIESFFAELLPQYSFRSGYCYWLGTKTFFIYSPSIGESIE